MAVESGARRTGRVVVLIDYYVCVCICVLTGCCVMFLAHSAIDGVGLPCGRDVRGVLIDGARFAAHDVK
jgi:hypothetical protein